MSTQKDSGHPGALSDLRVVEMGVLLAGPFAGQLFADFGAEVIKLEPPARATRCASGAWRSRTASRCGGRSWPEQEVGHAQPAHRRGPGHRARPARDLRPAHRELPPAARSSAGTSRPRRCGRSTRDSSSCASPASARPARWPRRPATARSARRWAACATSSASPTACRRAPASRSATPSPPPSARSAPSWRCTPASAPAGARSSTPRSTRRCWRSWSRWSSSTTRAATCASAPARSCPKIVAVERLPDRRRHRDPHRRQQDTVFKRLADAMGMPRARRRRALSPTHTARGEHQAELDDIIARLDADEDRRRGRGAHARARGAARQDLHARPRCSRTSSSRRARRSSGSRTRSSATSRCRTRSRSCRTPRARCAGPARTLGEHTDQVLTDVLGLSAGDIAKLRELGVV